MNNTLSKAVRLALAGAFISAGQTHAQMETDDASGFSIIPSVSYYMFDEDRNMDSAALGSIGIGYRTSTAWGYELTYAMGKTDLSNTNSEVDVEHLRLDALYHLSKHSGVQPFWVVGAGQQLFTRNDNEADNTMVSAGAGLKIDMGSTVAFRTDLRLVNDVDNELTSYAVNFGLNFMLGGGRAAPPVIVAPSDSDNDGVIDSQDRCPDTPAGENVDMNGCTIVLDDDRDGVSNENDKCPGTSAGAKVDDDGCYITITETKEINLNVEFENNAATVSPGSYSEISKVAEFMQEYPTTDVTLEGHSDDRGEASYNQQLSQQRAAAVGDVLVERFGVDRSRVSATGYGESRPLVPNTSEANRAQNRRVTAQIRAQVERVQK